MSRWRSWSTENALDEINVGLLNNNLHQCVTEFMRLEKEFNTFYNQFNTWTR